MPSCQHTRHFTVEEADKLLPWLSERAGEITRLFDVLEDKGFDIVSGRWKPRGNGHTNSAIPEEYGKFVALIAELDKEGFLMKNFRKGVVDIPHIRPDGEEVYLCWILGEEKIGFWHRIFDTFAERAPLERPAT
jgi:hypothetical protein